MEVILYCNICFDLPSNKFTLPRFHMWVVPIYKFQILHYFFFKTKCNLRNGRYKLFWQIQVEILFCIEWSERSMRNSQHDQNYPSIDYDMQNQSSLNQNDLIQT